MWMLADSIEAAELLKGRAASFRRRLTEQQCGAGRRVDLRAMVHFEDFDVPFGPEARGRLLDQPAQEIDSDRRVRRTQHGDRLRRVVDQLLMLLAEARRPDE